MMSTVLKVENIKTYFTTYRGVVKAVDGVSLEIGEREIVAVVGESGCGKSVTQLSVLQLVATPPGRIVDGKVWLDGQELLHFGAESAEMRSVRGNKIAMIFQEPMTSLNPTLTICRQITEMLQLHLKMNAADSRARAIELLDMVGIPDAKSRIDDYPHQFSGGMRQRVMIAIAMSCNPKILIADEPTTAIDVTTQAQLLEIMREVVNRSNTSLVIVTHNLGVVARYAHRIYVMYAGRVIEAGTAKDIFGNPRHPYTRGLLNSVPRLDEEQGSKLVPIEGTPPNLIKLNPTCAFLPRCKYHQEICETEPWPPLRNIGGRHEIACHLDIPDRGAEVKSGVCGELSVKPTKEERLVEVKDLKMYFPVMRGLLKRKIADVKSVDGVSFYIRKGETLGLVGESGCGKTTIGRCILRLYEPTDGQILFNGVDITHLPEKKLRPLRREMGVVFQDPYNSLDPRQTAGSIVGEALRIHRMCGSKKEREERIKELFREVDLDPSMADRVAHEFSGGQRQRIGIASAISCNPSLIVCDEPISALDVSIQAQVTNMLERLQCELGLTYLFVAHDLSVVKHISDRVAVMYLGRIVEITNSSELYKNPLHPYTKALLSAVPVPDPWIEEERERLILEGEIPSPLRPPSGCSFHPRCPIAIPACRDAVPRLEDMGGGHEVACIRV
jgi:peptide/nickel transport system ATP-binding protein